MRPQLLLNVFVYRTKKKTGTSWKIDETYIKLAGRWYYLYRAVDNDWQTVDFHFSKRRNKTAAHKFLKKAIKNNGIPEKVNSDIFC
ncbi:MAG: DDE-type integrase/transposase/recombinase [Bacteriovoracaceae bacterium]|nr:DDE-type integrase/transposase/recombinase [Bacteriovoracaceae bacterium]